MDTGVLAHKLNKRTHCEELMLFQIYYTVVKIHTSPPPIISSQTSGHSIQRVAEVFPKFMSPSLPVQAEVGLNTK